MGNCSISNACIAVVLALQTSTFTSAMPAHALAILSCILVLLVMGTLKVASHCERQKMAEQITHDAQHSSAQHSSAQPDPCYLLEMVWTMDSTSSIPMYVGEGIPQKHRLLHVSGQQDGHGHICCMCVCDTVPACRFDQSVQCCSIAWQ